MKGKMRRALYCCMTAAGSRRTRGVVSDCLHPGQHGPTRAMTTGGGILPHYDGREASSAGGGEVT